jgi:hypothetical protein
MVAGQSRHPGTAAQPLQNLLFELAAPSMRLMLDLTQNPPPTAWFADCTSLLALPPVHVTSHMCYNFACTIGIGIGTGKPANIH